MRIRLPRLPARSHPYTNRRFVPVPTPTARSISPLQAERSERLGDWLRGDSQNTCRVVGVRFDAVPRTGCPQICIGDRQPQTDPQNTCRVVGVCPIPGSRSARSLLLCSLSRPRTLAGWWVSVPQDRGICPVLRSRPPLRFALLSVRALLSASPFSPFAPSSPFALPTHPPTPLLTVEHLHGGVWVYVHLVLALHGTLAGWWVSADGQNSSRFASGNTCRPVSRSTELGGERSDGLSEPPFEHVGRPEHLQGGVSPSFPLPRTLPGDRPEHLQAGVHPGGVSRGGSRVSVARGGSRIDVRGHLGRCGMGQQPGRRTGAGGSVWHGVPGLRSRSPSDRRKAVDTAPRTGREARFRGFQRARYPALSLRADRYSSWRRRTISSAISSACSARTRTAASWNSRPVTFRICRSRRSTASTSNSASSSNASVSSRT